MPLDAQHNFGCVHGRTYKIAGDSLIFETRTQTMRGSVLPSFDPSFAPSDAFFPSCTTSHYQDGERDRLWWQTQAVEQEKITHLELHHPLRKDCIFPGELLQLILVLEFPGLSRTAKMSSHIAFEKVYRRAAGPCVIRSHASALQRTPRAAEVEDELVEERDRKCGGALSCPTRRARQPHLFPRQLPEWGPSYSFHCPYRLAWCSSAPKVCWRGWKRTRCAWRRW
jgi:hypothetical protein